MGYIKQVCILAILIVVMCIFVSCDSGAGIENTSPEQSVSKAFLISGTDVSSDHLKEIITYIQGQEKNYARGLSKDDTPDWIITLTKDVTDEGAVICGITGCVRIDFQQHVYTIASESEGLVIDNEVGQVELSGGIIRVQDNSLLSRNAAITSSSDVKINGTTIEINAAVNGIESSAGTLEISGSTKITTNDDQDAIVATGNADVQVTSSDVTVTGGLKMTDKASVDLGDSVFVPTKPIEKDAETILTASVEKIQPSQGSGVTADNIAQAVHNHVFSSDWVSDEKCHWHEAICEHSSLKSSYGYHSWSDWTTVVESTHTSAGIKTRNCSVCGATEQQIIPAKKDDHIWGDGVITIEPECTTAGVRTFYCLIDGCEEKKTEVIPELGHDYVSVITSPTATTDGYTTHTCSRCDAYYIDNIIPATGYSYGDPEWTWASDNSTATAEFIAKNDSSHSVVINAIITSKTTTEATCSTAGVRTYTASVLFDNATYTDTKTETIKATGHSYESPIWTWASDNTSASARFSCANNCGHVETVNATVTSTITTEATCTTNGVRTITARAVFNDVTYTDTKTETIKATGHSYESPTWTWTSDKTSASARFICANNNGHFENINATVTSKITTEATCTTDGVRTITASAVFIDVTYTDTKTETIKATGHSYESPIWTWSSGKTSASARFICANNNGHFENINATVTSKITTEATCTTAGERTYTASVTFNNTIYTDTKSESIPMLGHSYSDFWSFNGTHHWHIAVCGHDSVDSYGEHNWDESNICTECGIRREGAITSQIVDPEDYSLSITFPLEWNGSLNVVPGVSAQIQAVLDPSNVNAVFSFYLDGRVVPSSGGVLLLGTGSGKVKLTQGHHFLTVKAEIDETSYTEQYHVIVSDGGYGVADSL